MHTSRQLNVTPCIPIFEFLFDKLYLNYLQSIWVTNTIFVGEGGIGEAKGSDCEFFDFIQSSVGFTSVLLLTP